MNHILPLDEKITVKKAREAKAFKNVNNFTLFLKNCCGRVDFTTKFKEYVNLVSHSGKPFNRILE